MAEWLNRAPLTSYESKSLIEVSSEHTPINFPSRKNSFNTNVNDLTATVAASDTAETIEARQLTSPLFTQEREISSNPFGVSDFQQAAASIFKCSKSLANVQIWELQETGAGYCVIPKVTVKRKKVSRVRMCVILNKKEFCPRGKTFMNNMKRKQNELFKVSVWLREDYLRLRFKWSEEVRKGEILTLLSMKPISSLNHRDWSCIRRINGLIKLKENTVDHL